MNFLDMLQNDPDVRNQMDVLLGRAPAQGAPGGPEGQPPQGGGGSLSQAAQFDPSGQVGRHPDYSPLTQDPFTYGLTGGEHFFYGGDPNAPTPDPAPPADPNAGGGLSLGGPDWKSIWPKEIFEPLGQRARGGWAEPKGPGPAGYTWDIAQGYYAPIGHDDDGREDGD